MKKNIALIAGGDSSEHEISLLSAANIYECLKERYAVTLIVIRGKEWVAKISETETVPVDKNDFSVTTKDGKIQFDFAYITIHGTPGENGLLQGYLDLMHIPYQCCGVLAAALTFNKYACNHYLQDFGIRISPSLLLRKGEQITDAEVIEKIGLPCFIKSNVGGSSFGCTKVKVASDIQPAIQTAFKEGNEVIIEAFMKGVEVSCGVYKTQQKAIALPITEIVSQNEFFDYDAKYNGKVQEITPARIPDEVTKAIQAQALKIYDIIGCQGIIRVDYILTEGWTLNVLEINTTPGMTATSLVPQAMRTLGLNPADVLAELIEDHLK